MIRTSLRKNKYIIIFIMILFILGFISGTIYYYKLDINWKENIRHLIDSGSLYGFNTYHVLFTFLAIVLAYFYIGSIIAFFSLFLEGFSSGLITIMYIVNYHLNGLIFCNIYFIITKIIYFILLFILIKTINKIIKNKIIKNKDYLKKYNLLKKALLILLLILLNEYICSTLLNKILIYFSFLIK